jgi:tetratricopeptide (TPR) repeat protein
MPRHDIRIGIRRAAAAVGAFAALAAVGCGLLHPAGDTAPDRPAADAKPSAAVVDTADALDRPSTDSLFRTVSATDEDAADSETRASPTDLPPLTSVPNGDPRPGRPVGLIVCEPVPARGVGDADAAFAAGCGDWLMWNVGGLPEFDRTPLLTSIGRAQRELGHTQNLRLSLADARRLAAITGPTHVAVGSISSSGGRLTLTYSIYEAPSGKPVGPPIAVSGAPAAIRASLPPLGAQIARQLGVTGAAALPTAVELSQAEIASLGRCAWTASPPAADEAALTAAWNRSAFGAVIRLVADDRANVSQKVRDADVLLTRLAPANPLAWGEVGNVDGDALTPYASRLDALRRTFPRSYALAHADVWRQRASGTPRGEMAATADVVRDSPQDPDAWLSLASTVVNDADRLRYGRVADAISASEWEYLDRSYALWERLVAHAIALDPNHETAWERLAEAATFASDWGTADDAIRKAERICPDKMRVYDWALEMFQPKWRDDPASLRRVAEDAAAARYSSTDDVGCIACSLTDAGFDDQASQLLNRYLAAAELEISRRPNDPYAHWHRASIPYLLRRRQDSYNEYAAVVRLLPNDIGTQLDFGQELYDNEDMSAAMSVYHKVLAIDPDNATAALRIGGIDYALHRWSEAVKWLEIASQRSPKDSESHFLLGACYECGVPRRLTDAALEYRTAISLGDHNLRTYAWTAFALSDGGHPDEAVYWAKQGYALYEALKDDSPSAGVPDAILICSALAYADQKAGYNADAVTAGEEALAINPSDVNTNEALGGAYFALGQRHKARAAWKVVAAADLAGDPDGIKHARAMLVKYPENGT